MQDPILRLGAALEGRYHIESELGAGGMGTVYLAHDLKHNRAVAIKVLRPEVASTMGAERFLREVEIAAGLTHPHIVPLYDSGEADGLLYFVMPHIDGSSLKEHLESEGRLPVDRALEIARDVADGLAFAHEQGFVHRDIKPGNILVSGRHGLIVDFGVAKAAEAAADQGLTMAGVAVGTPAYMSPEQFSESHEADARSDIYSLGCVLYAMLTGSAPFRGRTAAAIFAGHLQGDVPPLDETRPDVPPEIAWIVMRMLAKDPEQRYQTATELVEELAGALTGNVPIRGRAKAAPLPRAALIGAALVAAGLFANSITQGVAPITVFGEDESVVVLPFEDAASTSDEKTMLVDLADEVTRQLNRWESVRAVPQVALAGISFDLGLSQPTLGRIDEGVRIAERSGVRTFVTLTGRIRGDTAIVTASQFDARTGRSIGEQVESIGNAADRFRLGAALVHALLGLEGQVEDVEELRRQSANPDALMRQSDGRRHLESWRLPEAEIAFRAAIEADSTFAMAHHYLALTLYWQAARDGNRLAALGPAIGRASLSANRHAGGLPATDSVHIHAFYQFQEGNYEGARATYQTLIDRDPTDVYALLLLGMVEYHDPWLTPGPDGSLVPRQNLNVALRSFGETVRLSPGFHLGYGHLFDITERVLRAADGEGHGFEVPRAESMPPWAQTDPFEMIAFHAVYTDSLVWLTRDALDGLDERGAAQEGANRLLGSSMRTLQRWADFAPTETQPLDELVNWTLRERSSIPTPASPFVLDSLAARAGDFAGRALSLRADTPPTELIRFGLTKLASGDITGATEVVEQAQRALDADPDAQRQPREASNLYIYRGQPGLALSVLTRMSVSRRYYQVPETGNMVDDRGAEPTIEAIRILGATGVSGPELEEAFQRLDALWSPSNYSAAELTFIRSLTAGRIAPSLALAPEFADAWLRDVPLTDPIWRLVRDTSAGSQTLLDAAADYAGELEVTRTSRAYVLGRYAQRIDRPDQALRHFARIDSIPLSIRFRDPGWGLSSLSLFHRGEAYEASGDTASAIGMYERFLEAWAEPDGLAPPFMEAAGQALSRSGR